jgi:DNA-binding transcriptional regulator YiaG
MDIVELRNRTGLSQSKFSKLTGVPLKTLQRWEQGASKPPKYVIPSLEKALKYDKVIK